MPTNVQNAKHGETACSSKKHVTQAREQIHELVDNIRPAPTADGYREAVIIGRYEEVLKLVLGRQVK